VLNMSKWLRISVAGIVSGPGGLIALVCCIAVPILIMDWIYGSKKVEDSPGSGGAVVIAAFPFGVILGIAVFVFLARAVYCRLSKSDE
jgi:VIT1/CCC1 family predicted Fe2+/Mn2+ transporter